MCPYLAAMASTSTCAIADWITLPSLTTPPVSRKLARMSWYSAPSAVLTCCLLRWFPRQMVVPLTYTCTDSRILPFTSFYVGVKVNAVGVKVKVAAQWLWGVKVNMGG
jgi:hypothetical protein